MSFSACSRSKQKLENHVRYICMANFYLTSKLNDDEDPSLRIESFAMVNLRSVSIKLYFGL